jgi:hypothetical protein
MKYICLYNRGRFGNAVFRFLASRLFCILFNYSISNVETKDYYISFTDENFIEWMKQILLNNTLLIISEPYIEFGGYYQHDTIYRLFKKELIDYIINNPDDTIVTDEKEKFKCITLLGEKPTVSFNYKTVVHLRIEDFIDFGLAMNPLCLDPVLEKCEEPFLFVHKPVENTNDEKYINYFKKKYPNSYFYTEDLILSYNIMRHAEVLVCSRSTLSWVSALFNEVNVKTFIPKNYGLYSHETFQYPNDTTEVYEWKTLTKDELMAL